MTIALRIGLIVIALVTVVVTNTEYFVPKSVDCRKAVTWNEVAPHGAIWPREVVHWDHVPIGYTALVGWINLATIVPCLDTTAVKPEVEIRRITIIGLDSEGNEKIVESIDPRDTNRFTGRLFPRVPHWFGETKGRDEILIALSGDEGVTFRIDQVPLRIYHAWTNPRLPLDPTLHYSVEVEARITKTARLQFGLDYWRDAEVDYAGWDQGCIASTNCEGFVSDWHGDTGGEFLVFRAPVSAAAIDTNSLPRP